MSRPPRSRPAPAATPSASRLARTLLTAQDHAEGGTFPMTHEVLSMLLGVRRSGVTTIAGAFQQQGLIHHGGGRITITDRAGLERATCECYHAIQSVFGRLLPLGPCQEPEAAA
ncbi:helix-turn-helix domain-containing protein [Belnapia rosea]|jgi:hypothetical protein|nr:helix-turn-helix domain-containing protein [Belnapia rosea]